MFDNNYEFNKLTVAAQSYNNKVSVELPLDSNLNEFVNACRVLAIGLTYHEDSWKRVIIDMADEYREELAVEFGGVGVFRPDLSD
jgi:hypothetical protein